MPQVDPVLAELQKQTALLQQIVTQMQAALSFLSALADPKVTQ